MSPIRFCLPVAAVILCAFWFPAAHAQDFTRTPLPGKHPLLGQWRIDLPQLACFEEYRLRADGTRSVIAGQERAESEFMIAPVPGAKGFYKWTDRITKNNGKPDCTGSITEAGHTVENFILVHPDGNHFLLCKQADIDTCFGPYVRKKAGNT